MNSIHAAMSPETTKRWLILDQDTERSEWHVPRDTKALVVSELRIEALPQMSGAVLTTASICIVFLPERNPGDRLSEYFDNRLEKRWNVWCHYGGGLSLRDVPNRWNRYERLSEEEKRILLHGADDVPKPFSCGQQLPWSPEFEELKRLIAKHKPSIGSPKTVSRRDFGQALTCLEKAWHLAGAQIGLQEKVHQNKAALPALLAARAVLAEISGGPSHRPLSGLIAMLERVREAFRTTGLASFATSKEGCSEEVREKYRKLNYVALVGWLILARTKESRTKAGGNENRSLAEETLGRRVNQHLEALHAALDDFISAVDSQARETTAEMRLRPRLPV